MDNMMDTIRKALENTTFCFAKEGGQGFVDKSTCACLHEKTCQAFKDHERFHHRFKELECEYGDLKRRNEIIQIIKPEFIDSFWWKENVKE